MKTKLFFCLLLLLSFQVGISYSQKSLKKITVSGYVKDGTDTPVANAIIIVDGEKTAFFTNDKGFYKARINQGSSSIGVLTQTSGKVEEPINGRGRIDFRFEGSVPIQVTGKADPEDEAVDMGLRTAKKKSLTSPVDVVDGTKSKYASYNNIYDMIKNEVPGVMVSGNSIRIRTATSINASNEPLFVVDGVPVNTIDNIVPQMVKSIQVLKGSSAAIYGMRGSNGVIVISLLKGSDK
ncbi:MAG: TonB-dependent receptor plug domain-containing protein [Bacteroidales bacterium]|jgi:TonB-dependent SusC/RagA subfamily outer membrane receptor|nr:TonB-dependent receptor plug domain-containing protein [Bacteroidales bacterium]